MRPSGHLAVVFAVILFAAVAPPAGASGTASADTVEVTVVEVVDGDTIEVRFANGTIDTVRLLGIDTPEVSSETSPGEFEGVPDTAAGRDCLSTAADDATAAVADRIAGETVTLQFDDQSDARGYYGRLLAYVLVDGANLNYRLVADGHARVYDSTFTQSNRFYSAEDDAQATETGVWDCRSIGEPTASGLELAAVHADAPGDDHENLEGEWIRLSNGGRETLDLAGWTVSDAAGHTYTVPAGVSLAPGAAVTLYTGEGADTAADLYWGNGRAVWNNGGDTITVVDASGAVVLERSYDDPNREFATSSPGPTLPGSSGPATDLDGDGLLEDVDGDGIATVRDVFVYYTGRESAAVQDNPSLFDFDGDGDAGTIFDALTLYRELS